MAILANIKVPVVSPQVSEFASELIVMMESFTFFIEPLHAANWQKNSHPHGILQNNKNGDTA